MTVPRNILWTPEEDDELRSSILASKDIATIAKYLNRTRTAIRRRAAKLKLPLKVVTVGLKAREISNANDDTSPLIDLLTCIVCNATMKIAKTALRSPHAPDAAASTATCPNVRDDGRRPSGGTGWREFTFDLPDGLSGIFLRNRLDRILK